MITALLRHEFLRTRAMLGVIFGAAAALTAVGALLGVLGWPVLDVLGITIAGIAIACLVPGVMLALALDYYRSSYQGPGHLTQTLPIRSRTIYGAKLLWTLLASFAGLLVSVLLLGLLWPALAAGQGLDPNPFAMVATLWDAATQLTSAWTLIGAIALLVLSLLAYMPMWLAAMSIGSEERFQRFGHGGPVIVAALLYTVTQVLFAIGIFAVPFAFGSTPDGELGIIRFDAVQELIASQDATVVPLGFIPMVFLLAAWAIWRTARSWHRKVALT